jgi:hypothetical protein
MAKGGLRGRGRMGQVVTPDEMAALLEGLRETGGGQDFELRPSPTRIMTRGQGFPEHRQISCFQNLSNWLMAMTEIQWPSL